MFRENIGRDSLRGLGKQAVQENCTSLLGAVSSLEGYEINKTSMSNEQKMFIQHFEASKNEPKVISKNIDDLHLDNGSTSTAGRPDDKGSYQKVERLSYKPRKNETEVIKDQDDLPRLTGSSRADNESENGAVSNNCLPGKSQAEITRRNRNNTTSVNVPSGASEMAAHRVGSQEVATRSCEPSKIDIGFTMDEGNELPSVIGSSDAARPVTRADYPCPEPNSPTIIEDEAVVNDHLPNDPVENILDGKNNNLKPCTNDSIEAKTGAYDGMPAMGYCQMKKMSDSNDDLPSVIGSSDATLPVIRADCPCPGTNSPAIIEDQAMNDHLSNDQVENILSSKNNNSKTWTHDIMHAMRCCQMKRMSDSNDVVNTRSKKMIRTETLGVKMNANGFFLLNETSSGISRSLKISDNLHMKNQGKNDLSFINGKIDEIVISKKTEVGSSSMNGLSTSCNKGNNLSLNSVWFLQTLRIQVRKISFQMLTSTRRRILPINSRLLLWMALRTR